MGSNEMGRWSEMTSAEGHERQRLWANAKVSSLILPGQTQENHAISSH
jgi:hypothetical protein